MKNIIISLLTFMLFACLSAKADLSTGAYQLLEISPIPGEEGIPYASDVTITEKDGNFVIVFANAPFIIEKTEAQKESIIRRAKHRITFEMSAIGSDFIMSRIYVGHTPRDKDSDNFVGTVYSLNAFVGIEKIGTFRLVPKK